MVAGINYAEAVKPFSYFSFFTHFTSGRICLQKLIITCRPTCVSRALKGSSNMYTSELEYTALAIETLCFCPPLIFTPLSPISVRSLP